MIRTNVPGSSPGLNYRKMRKTRLADSCNQKTYHPENESSVLKQSAKYHFCFADIKSRCLVTEEEALYYLATVTTHNIRYKLRRSTGYGVKAWCG